jgi:hypothetical protein
VNWGVFLEPEVRSSPMVVPDIGHEDAAQMRFVDDDHVIETLASERADQAFDGRGLPRTRRNGDDFADTHANQSALEDVAVDAVSIFMHPARRGVVRKRVDHLLRRPGCGWMIRDVDMHMHMHMRRRSCVSTTRTNSTRPVSVETVKKSIDAAEAR